MLSAAPRNSPCAACVLHLSAPDALVSGAVLRSADAGNCRRRAERRRIQAATGARGHCRMCEADRFGSIAGRRLRVASELVATRARCELRGVQTEAVALPRCVPAPGLQASRAQGMVPGGVPMRSARASSTPHPYESSYPVVSVASRPSAIRTLDTGCRHDRTGAVAALKPAHFIRVSRSPRPILTLRPTMPANQAGFDASRVNHEPLWVEGAIPDTCGKNVTFLPSGFQMQYPRLLLRR